MRRNLRHYFGACAAVAVALGLDTSCLGQEARNLIPNAGFESGTGENPVGWKKDICVNRGITDWANALLDTESKRFYRMGVTTTDAHSGKSCYAISDVWSYAGQLTGVSLASPVPIKADGRYVLSFWYKTKDINEYPIPLIVETTVGRHREQAMITDKRVPSRGSWTRYLLILDNFPDDAKDLTIGFYSWFRTRGSIWIDDISLTEATPGELAEFETWRRPARPAADTRSEKPKFTASGYYQVINHEGRWHLVDPSGKAVWAASIMGEVPLAGEHLTGPRTAGSESPYGRTADEAARNMYKDYLDLGFTAFAGWTDERYARLTEERYANGEPYIGMVKVLELVAAGGDAVKIRDRNGAIPAKDKRLMVDPYNPEWRKAARETATTKIAPYKDKPWFLGWFVDNEMFYEDLFRYVWAEYSAKEFKQLLERKYGSITALNSAWTSSHGTYNYDSFDEILVDKPEPRGWTDPLLADFTLFERQMISAYVDYTYNLVKELDPNHLVISNRFHWRAMPNLYRHVAEWSKHDIVAINIYPNNNVIGYDTGELAAIEWLHRNTGRPMIIGEWSIPSLDSGLYSYDPDPLGRPIDWSWHQLVKTQKERGEIYETCVKQLAGSGFMIGAGWFTTIDFDMETRRSNRGIMNSGYEMYRDLTSVIKTTHETINR